MYERVDRQHEHSYFIAEYGALSEYFGKVITFRFTTASFFIAAIALTLGVDRPRPSHYVLLFLIGLGLWIVELRNRSIAHNLLQRAADIETRWGENGRGQLPLFTHLNSIRAAREGHPDIPGWAHHYDRFVILGIGSIQTRHITHSLGFDIVYISAMIFSLISLFAEQRLTYCGASMRPILAIVTVVTLLAGTSLIRTAGSSDRVHSRVLLGIAGAFLVLFAAYLILHAIGVL